MFILSQLRSNLSTRMSMRWLGLVANALILGLWIWLHRPVFDHLRIIFTREDFRTSQIILIGTLILIAYRIHQQKITIRLDAAPRLHPPALALTLVTTLVYLVNERWLDINALSACLFGLASYGLLGLWMQPHTWREGIPAALLLIGALPFGDFIQTFIGYPMRLLTAEIVRRGFALIGSNAMGLDTILVFENRVAQVDVPCSGVKSLWTGSLFLIAATWIEHRAINLRWLCIALAFVLLLFIANLARVAVLVGVGQVMGYAPLAELLHVPLGVLGFAAACALAVLLLRPPSPRSGLPNSRRRLLADAAPRQHATTKFTLALITTLTLFNLAYTARSPLSPTQFHDTRIALPPTLITQPITLRPGEMDWLINDGAEAVERVRFRWGNVGGSMLLVQSRTWRAHHKPERCFENYGLRVEFAETQLLHSNLPVKAMTLSNDKLTGQRSALYWFQSKDKVTDDYGTRLWSAMSLRPERWMLVTVLFDDAYPINTPQHKDVTTLAAALQAAVQAQLENP